MSVSEQFDSAKGITQSVTLSRFQILELLTQHDRGISTRELAEMSRCPGWYSRDFRASLHARLRKLWRYGLVKRRLNRWLRPYHARCGVYLWTISTRGKVRLEWAKQKSLLDRQDRDGR